MTSALILFLAIAVAAALFFFIMARQFRADTIQLKQHMERDRQERLISARRDEMASEIARLQAALASVECDLRVQKIRAAQDMDDARCVADMSNTDFAVAMLRARFAREATER
jgi:HAMP domain-containing protein